MYLIPSQTPSLIFGGGSKSRLKKNRLRN